MKYEIRQGNIVITADEHGYFSIKKGENIWNTDMSFVPYIMLVGENKHKINLLEANWKVEEFSTGVGTGIRYEVSNIDGNAKEIVLELKIWIEKATEDVRISLLAIKDEAVVEEVCWPAPFVMDEQTEDSITVLPMMQGVIIPNNYEKELFEIDPPAFLERSAYMPWYGQIRNESGYMVIIDTPWDAGYRFHHPAGGPTKLNLVFYESLNRVGYKRSLRITLFEKCSYVAFCKHYRNHIKEHEGFASLKQKIAATPKIERLIGSPVIHTTIKWEVKPEAQIYDKENVANNSRLHTFNERKEQLKSLYNRGVKKAYVHLDGWGVKGYDWQHPDVLPPCEEAGGAEGLRELGKTCVEQGYLFTLHDQYRDYYIDAATFDEKNATMQAEGTHKAECTWNGGEQRYLCASLAYDYVKRNYTKISSLDIPIDGAYLDVFSVMRLDECFDPAHKMTRKECSDYRNECFRFITANYGIVSSEEPISNTVFNLALSHHAPYPTAPTLAKGEERGIPVPLFNLVYHDSVLTPWNISEEDESVMPNYRSGFLYALLNGGLGYLSIDATEEEIERNKVVCDLNQLVALEEMVNHEFIDGDYERQRTTFSNGIVVEVDFRHGVYEIKIK